MATHLTQEWASVSSVCSVIAPCESDNLICFQDSRTLTGFFCLPWARFWRRELAEEKTSLFLLFRSASSVFKYWECKICILNHQKTIGGSTNVPTKPIWDLHLLRLLIVYVDMWLNGTYEHLFLFRKELKEAQRTNKPCGKCHYYLLISKTFTEATKNSKKKEGRNRQKEELMFANAEEEFFYEVTYTVLLIWDVCFHCNTQKGVSPKLQGVFLQG